jgi:O-antigen/teichoic acid export membrane protein
VLQLAAPVATLVGIVVLIVFLARGVAGAVTAWLFAQTVVFAAALAVTSGIWRPLKLRSLSRDLGRRMLLLGLRAGLVNVVSLLNYRIELFVLKAYRGIDAVGVYSVSVSLAELLWIVSGALATATTALAVSASDDDAVTEIARGVRAAIAATALAGIALAVVSPFAIPFLFGPRFSGATVPLLILIPGVLAFSPGQLFAVYFSMRLGETRIPLGVAVASAALTGALAVLVIPLLGLTGAALATSVGYALSMSIAAILFSRRAGIAISALVPGREDIVTYRSVLLELFRR